MKISTCLSAFYNLVFLELDVAAWIIPKKPQTMKTQQAQPQKNSNNKNIQPNCLQFLLWKPFLL